MNRLIKLILVVIFLYCASGALAQETVYSGWLNGNQISIGINGKVAAGFMGIHQISWRVKQNLIFGQYDNENFLLYIEPNQITGKIGDLSIVWFAEGKVMDRSLGVAE